MSLQQYQRAVALMQLRSQDRKWFPKWLKGYAQHHRLSNSEENNELKVTRELLIGYLRALRDRGVPAWQRLQAARALEAYQSIVLRQSTVDFMPIRSKLLELAALEGKVGGPLKELEKELVPGEGNEGKIEPHEPKPVQQLRRKMRLLHHPISTEIAYAKWVRRFVRHVDDERLDRYGEQEIADFLTEFGSTCFQLID